MAKSRRRERKPGLAKVNTDTRKASLPKQTAVDIQQSTLPDIIETEHRLAMTAAERYGEYYKHAEAATSFISLFPKSVPPTLPIFARFWSLTKKHHLLALLSTVRLHGTQAMMDLRQTLEAAVCAAFAIVHTDPALFADTTAVGTLDSSQALSRRRYRWLDDNFPDASRYIKDHKDRINNSTAHANIVYTHRIFELRATEYNLPFFDIEDEYHTCTDLYTIGAIGISLMDLFYGVNDRHGRPVEFVEGFEQRLLSLNAQSAALQKEMLADPRSIALAQRIAASERRDFKIE
jgi:hypothetical protein